jgi:ABC-type multidrug transport system ATPase subunit
MQIVLSDTGKRFGTKWIIRGVNQQFHEGESTAILGPNGSGKSTLLRLISTYYTPSEGTVAFIREGMTLETDEVYRYIAYAAPYLDLVEQMTLEETLLYHHALKPFFQGIDQHEVLHILDMQGHQDKQLVDFSSGMKMKVKLALAILSNTPVLLLDEPLSNLDEQGRAWYQELISKFIDNRVVLICSNKMKEEYSFCKRTLELHAQ